LFGRLFFDFFLEKIKKQAPKHHFISPPEAAKCFLYNPKNAFFGQRQKNVCAFGNRHS
jgi:hypothetical protein